MALVIEREFLTSFYKLDKGQEVMNFEGFLRGIRDLPIKVILNYPDRDEFEKEMQDNALLRIIFDNPQKMGFIGDFSPHLESLSLSSSPFPFKLFLIERPSEECELLSKKYGYAYLSSKNLKEEWPIFNTWREDISMVVSKSNKVREHKRFDHWNKLRAFSHPINSVIIFDRYLFATKSNYKFDLLLKKNVKPLLKNLLKQGASNRPIDLLFAYEKDPVGISMKKLYHELNSWLQSAFPNKKIHLKISKIPPPWAVMGEKEHDRFIITNYFWIHTDAGFNIFVEKNEIFHRSDIHFDFVFAAKNYDHVVSPLENLAKYLKQAVGHPKVYSPFVSKA